MAKSKLTQNPILARRKARGLTALELARRAGMSPAHLCDVEKGRTPLHRVRVDFALALAEELGVPPSELFPRATPLAA